MVGFIGDLDGHAVKGSRWQVVPEVAKLARYIHGFRSSLMDVGHFRPYKVSVAISTVVNMEIVAGHDFSGSGKDDRRVDRSLA